MQYWATPTENVSVFLGPGYARYKQTRVQNSLHFFSPNPKVANEMLINPIPASVLIFRQFVFFSGEFHKYITWSWR